VNQKKGRIGRRDGDGDEGMEKEGKKKLGPEGRENALQVRRTRTGNERERERRD
jgi:hypothetical protein